MKNTLCKGKRRPGLICLAFVLLAVPLAGCGRATPLPVDPVTITFAYRGRGDEDHFVALAESFSEAHPDVVVEVRRLESTERDDATTIDADVFWAPAESMWALRDEGRILSVGPFVEQDVTFEPSDFYPGLFDYLSFGGETWGVPAGLDLLVMFYNRDLFDAYDVPYPYVGWDWDDFLERALALRDSEYDWMGDMVDVYGYGARWYEWEALHFIYQHGGGLVDDTYAATARVTLDDPLTIDALEWYGRLFHVYGVSPTPEEAIEEFGGNPEWRGSGVSEGIGVGRIAMWVDSFSDRGDWFWAPEWFFEWGVAPLPRDERAAQFVSLDACFISSETLHAGACWEWVSYLSREMPPREIPPRRSLTDSVAFEEYVGSDDALAARAALEGGMLPPRTTVFWEGYEAFGDAVEEIVEGTATAREAMARLQWEMGE